MGVSMHMNQQSTVQRRRVWIVNHYANTPDLPGGTRQYEIAAELVAAGYEATVFSADFNLALRRGSKVPDWRLVKEESIGGVTFVWVKVIPYQHNDWRRVLNMLNFALALLWIGVGRPRPHVIIGSSPHLFAAAAARVVAWWRSTLFYFEVRDLWPQVLIDMGGKSEGSLMVRSLRVLERFLYTSSRRVIVLAQGAVDYVVSRGATAQRTHWLPNSTDLEGFQPMRSRLEVLQSFGLEQNRFYVTYAGAHGEANALETVVEAARLLEQILTSSDDDNRPIFLLIGDGPEKAALEKRAQGLHSIKLLPAVPKAQISDVLNASDALLITLRDVPLFRYAISPNKLFDYFAAAKPVIASVGGDVSHLVTEHGVGVGITPESSQELAGVVQKLANTPAEQLAAMGRAGRVLAEQRFSRKAVARQLIALLREDGL
jgi:glycosyltransferase involved in cell wall biosynthesis